MGHAAQSLARLKQERLALAETRAGLDAREKVLDAQIAATQPLADAEAAAESAPASKPTPASAPALSVSSSK